MIHSHDAIRSNLLAWAGVHERLSSPVGLKPELSYERLKETEWSKEFERWMRYYLIIGAFRYGVLNAKNKPQWDRITACFERLENYRKTKNKEMLVDVANFCLLEYEEGMGVWAPSENSVKVRSKA